MSLPLAFLVAKWRTGTAGQATSCPWSFCLLLTVFSGTSETGLVKAARELHRAGETKRKHFKPKAMTEDNPCEHLLKIRQKGDLSTTDSITTSENNLYHLSSNSYQLSYALGNLNTLSLIPLPTARQGNMICPILQDEENEVHRDWRNLPTVCRTPNRHALSTAPNAFRTQGTQS